MLPRSCTSRRDTRTSSIAANSRASAGLRIVAMTFQLLLANSRAAVLPRPDDVPVIKTVFLVLFVVMVFVPFRVQTLRVMIVVEVLSCRHRSQAAGKGVTDFDFQAGFALRQPRAFAFVCFLFVLLLRFTESLSHGPTDASKTSLLSNR